MVIDLPPHKLSPKELEQAKQKAADDYWKRIERIVAARAKGQPAHLHID